uniref:Uncharacterized protein n=1 Tax=Cacopsylla melanoneura TaxID=428564 RepID=A0A8D8ZUN3_9HEMI
MALTSLLAVTRQGLTIKISSTVWTWAARRWTWVVSPAYPLGRLLYRRSPIRVRMRTISLTPCPMMIISTRRNDPVAISALWPFLGIVVEVVVLCTISLIYEKKRNKSELEESDTDQSPEQDKK